MAGPSQPLCNTCNQIDFASYFTPNNDNNPLDEGTLIRGSKPVSLGNRHSVRARSTECAFCALATTALDHPDNSLKESDDGDVTIQSLLIGSANSNPLSSTTSDQSFCLKVAVRIQWPGRIHHPFRLIQLLETDARSLGLWPQLRCRLPSPSHVDISLAKRWLEICLTQHGGKCSTPGRRPEERIPSPQPVDLLTIDLANMCICEMPHGATFSALSYCWPSDSSRYLVHWTSNSKALFQAGSLEENFQRLPYTIQDAIACAREMGIRYFWIDALCIIQDSAEHKEKQLHQMDLVYGAADEWTLTRAPIAGVIAKMRSYEEALGNFTNRDISFPADYLNSFMGIQAVLKEAMQTDFWQGLPERILDQALCWVSRGSHSRRAYQDGQVRAEDPVFPSWSFAGWNTPVTLNTYLPIARHESVTDWFIVNGVGQAVHLQSEARPEGELRYSANGNKDVTPPDVDVFQYLRTVVPRHRVNPMAPEWKAAKILAAWTTRAFFQLDGTTQSLNGHETVFTKTLNLAIKDANGVVAGCILLPPDFAEDCRINPMRCEFILITRALRSKYSQFQRSSKYYDVEVYPDRDWCTLNVMMISKLESGLVVRVGVGIIHEDAWVAAKPEGVFLKII
ncbi:HET-domain-containing protein [Sporormia fimetaria CBS 119925]|uniref:HET-domain-containing protein n=1 Tax=Sporormia fimetaria CBS 119925 TaxID=1340428 RepID=A0A6A6V7G8_9PLEO|nr:HET-domain-containing protein [Sporormia fimetaria CBS 119925]